MLLFMNDITNVELMLKLPFEYSWLRLSNIKFGLDLMPITIVVLLF